MLTGLSGKAALSLTQSKITYPMLRTLHTFRAGAADAASSCTVVPALIEKVASRLAYSSFQRARIGLLPFVPLQRPENNEQAIRGNADEDAHEAFETGRNIGYSAWPLNQRDQKAEDKVGSYTVPAGQAYSPE